MAYNGILQMYRGIPLNIGNEDTILFESRSAQEIYFDRFQDTRLTFGPEDFKFVREEGYVKVAKSHDFLENCNYLRFNNVDLTGQQTTRKWYYAFITGLDYINDTTTGVHFVIDVLQTWLPNIDYDLNDCFIERQHSAEDDIGSSLATETIRAYKTKTYEEHIENIVGSTFYVGVLFTYYDGFFNTRLTVVDKTVGSHEYSTNLGSTKIDGTVTGSTLLLFKVANGSGAVDDDSLINLRNAIRKTTILTQRDFIEMDTIAAIYMIPASLVDERYLLDVYCGTIGDSLWYAQTPATRYSDDGGDTWSDFPATGRILTINPNFDIDQIGNYEPKNKKLLSSQYTTYQIVNTDGNVAVFEPEGFTKQSGSGEAYEAPEFEVFASLLPPCKPVIGIGGLVDYYFGATQNHEQLFPAGELPNVSLNIDTYHAWLEKQFVSKIITATGLATGNAGLYGQTLDIARDAGGISKTGKPLYGTAKKLHTDKMLRKAKGAIAEDIKSSAFTDNSVREITRSANDFMNMERPVPMCAGNGNNMGLPLLSQGLFNLSFRKVAPIESELVRIDNYFTAYGYAVNSIARPNLKTRTRFTYIKTRGARNTAKYDTNNHDGIPAEYMEAINDLFDQGIRFWRNVSGMNIADLTSDNPILS